jgi:signal transduction histidine kinase/ligand-binding sensor domain-containing protein
MFGSPFALWPHRRWTRRSSLAAGQNLPGLLIIAALAWLLLGASSSITQAAVLWSDLASTLVHENGEGSDILNGALKRDDSSTDTLYFKLHVDPLSDASTEEYLAAFELCEGGEERLGIGNALKAWAYSAFKTVDLAQSGSATDYIDLRSSRPEPAGPGSFYTYEHPHRGLESTIVFRVQYVAGGDDLITVWLNPDLGPGANETSQPESLVTRFTADASFDEIHLRHNGGGNGWIFSELEIATAFSDFTAAANPPPEAGRSEVGQGEFPFTFRSWQTEQGLPQNYVRALAQTLDGCLWVGSDDGVVRFDGARFVSFGLQAGLHSGPVRTLLGDSRGSLWIGGASGGLTCFQEGQFFTLTTRDGLPSDSVTALAEEDNGRIWVGTEAGLVVWNGECLSLPLAAEAFRDKRITALFRDAKGTLWLGAAQTGVFRLEKGRFSAVADTAVNDLLKEPHCLLVDKQGRLWVGAGDDLVLYLEGKRWRPYRIPRHQARPYVTSLAEGPEGTIWAGSAGEGLFQFKGGKAEVIRARSGLSDNTAECLLVDRDGVLWVGTHGGLNRLRRRNLFVFGASEGLGYGAVQSLAEVLPGVVWAGKAGDGLYRWEGRNFSRLPAAGLGLVGPQINALLRVRDGSCWVAGAHGLLHFKDPTNAASQGEFYALAGRNVLALAEDEAGLLWIGTREGEIWLLNHGTWRTQTNLWQTHPITAIVHGRDGSVFLGTDGGGLERYLGPTHDHFDRNQGLLSDLIRTLYLDAQGTLWVGTAGGGLSLWVDGRISTFTTREGLPDNTISQILEDDTGRLWLGSNRGIAGVTKTELSELPPAKIRSIYPQVYGRGEGMVSEECTGGFYPAGLKTKSGRLWFSTLKGIVAVDTRLRTTESSAPSVLLEEVLVDRAPVSAFKVSSALRESSVSSSRPEKTSSALLIPPGKHRLELVYTAVSFDAPERVRFRYQLEGLDSDWVDAGTRRSTFYNYVPPGNYCFRVTACNGDGVWNQSASSLALTVLPYFWQTPWFIGLGAGGLLVSVVGSVRLVEKRKLHRRVKRLEQERMLEQERTRIAQDLHDEMGARLCRISFMSAHARRAQDVPDELKQQIAAISDDSREVLHSLDEIVWAVNPQNDTLEHLASYIGQYAQDYFQETGVACELDIPAQIPPHPLSSQWRHHLFLAVHEALTNILKHSQATRAKIEVISSLSVFTIIVSDNGRGFVTPNAENHGGNGLRNMRQRLADIGGRCELESAPGRGTTIRLFFPLTVPSAK